VHGACGGAELASAAATWATRRRGGVTRTSSPHLLAGASVFEARRLGGACVEQPRQRGAGKAGGAVEAEYERRGTDAHFESLAYF